MYDDIPIVPNLYSAPENPNYADCYYNITLDKYYIYNGTQWLEAKIQEDSTSEQDIFELKYSLDGGVTITTLQYTDFDELRTALNSPPINEASYIGIVLLSNPAILIPRTNDLSLDGVALLKLKGGSGSKKRDAFQLKYKKSSSSEYITEIYWDFSFLEDRMNSSALNGAIDIQVSMFEIEDPYVDESELKDTFVLRYSVDNGQTFIEQQYDNFEDLTNQTHSSDMMDVTDISITMPNSSLGGQDLIVGKIYPKIIFNQQLVENLNMNTNEMNNAVFDNVLVFYKEKLPTYKISYRWNPEDEYSIIYVHSPEEIAENLVYLRDYEYYDCFSDLKIEEEEEEQ